jgi:hypothetical protein
LLGFICVCLGFHCPICVSVRCSNGAAFQSGALRSFLGFLPGPTELVGVTGSIMLQRRKYCQSFVMFLLFANVADSCSDYVIVMVIILYEFICVIYCY